MDRPARKPNRLPTYDYSTPGAYFLTLCTKDKQCILGKIVGGGALDAPRIRLTNAGTVVEKYIVSGNRMPGVTVDKFVVMPNHVHLILILEDGTTKLPDVIGQYKSAVTRQLRKMGWNQPVWQTSFHDHVIRDQMGYERIWTYIDTNPIRWKDDCFYIE